MIAGARNAAELIAASGTNAAPCGKRLGLFGRRRQRQARLPNAARADDRDQPAGRVLQQRAELRQLGSRARSAAWFERGSCAERCEQ